MSVTPSEAPSRRAVKYVVTSDSPVLYNDPPVDRYVVRVPAPAPPEIQVQLELGREEAGVWAHIPELDVSAEGVDVREAFLNVIMAARAWLTYVREEAPDLGAELKAQQGYVELLDAPVFSWFKSFRFVE